MVGWSRALRTGRALLGLAILAGLPRPALGQEAAPPSAAAIAPVPADAEQAPAPPTEEGPAAAEDTAPAPAAPAPLPAATPVPLQLAPPPVFEGRPLPPPALRGGALAPSALPPPAATASPAAIRASISARLRARGFTPAQIEQAFADYGQYGTGDPLQVERLAAFRLLRLPMSEASSMIGWNMTVTRYHNWRIGGVGQRVAGWVLLGGGLTSLGVGGMMYLAGQDCHSSSSSTRHDPTIEDDSTVPLSSDRAADDVCHVVFDTFTLVYGLTGVVLTAVGVPLMSAGTEKTDRWAPDELLDTGSTTDLARYALGAGEGGTDAAAPAAAPAAPAAAAPRASLTPWVLPDGRAGLGFALRF